jgi:hypothetical protein
MPKVAVRIEDYRETLRGHRVLHLVGKGSKPATMPLTVPVLRVLEACRGERTEGRWCSGRSQVGRSTDGTAIGWSSGSPRPPASAASARTRFGTLRSPTPWTPACRSAMPRSWPGTPTHAPPSTTTAPAEPRPPRGPFPHRLRRRRVSSCRHPPTSSRSVRPWRPERPALCGKPDPAVPRTAMCHARSIGSAPWLTRSTRTSLSAGPSRTPIRRSPSGRCSSRSTPRTRSNE